MDCKQFVFSIGVQLYLTAMSKDGGVDVSAYYFDQKTSTTLKYVIQVKRWKQAIGVHSVRDIQGAKTDNKADKAVIVSVSGFTKTAIEFAARNDVQLILIKMNLRVF